MKKIVKGNDFTLRIPVMKMVEGQAKAFPLPACTDIVVQVCNQFKRIPLAFEVDVKEDNVLLARVEGDKMSLGTYAIEVKGKIFGNDWRSNEYPQFAIVANNADADTEFGETDEGDNSVEMDTAMVILPPSVELSDLISKANEALKNNKETNDTINTNEEARKEAETLRGTAEQGRASAEEARVSAEGSRTKAEEGRVSAEGERVKAEKTRADAEIKRKSDFDTAIKAAETATTGAETCNVELSGSTISVTNRNGETKSVDVINTDEEVTVTIASSVDSIKVAGIKINVFLNNGKTPQSYTTDTEGKATFTIDRGNYYQVTFPEYGNAQPIAPQGYTAVLGSRNINVEYTPYDEDSMEKVIITATKYDNNVGTAWEGIPVIVTVDKKATTYQTDEKGQVTVFVPYKKEYTVVIDDQDGYNVSFNKNSRTYTANVPQRLIGYRFYQFKAGIFVVDIDKKEYYIEDWVAAGRNADDAVAIKVADASLSINKGTFCIRTSDIKNVSKLISMSWCSQDLQFNSIALNGNNVKDANYYNGESSSFLIRQEAHERSLSVPALDYAYGQIFNLGGEDLHGFVMSIGQEYVHAANIGIIKQVLETLYGETVATDYYNLVIKKRRWTSTQYSATNAWNYSSSANNNYKPYNLVVLPVFAC
nr:MAG TPA: collagen adhesion protein [Caudoviricetes sp.]